MDEFELISNDIISVHFENFIDLKRKINESDDSEIAYNQLVSFSFKDNIPSDDDNENSIGVCNLIIAIQDVAEETGIEVTIEGIYRYSKHENIKNIYIQALSELWPIINDTTMELLETIGIIFDEDFGVPDTEEITETVEAYILNLKKIESHNNKIAL